MRKKHLKVSLSELLHSRRRKSRTYMKKPLREKSDLLKNQ